MNQQQPPTAGRFAGGPIESSPARTLQCPGCGGSMILPNELRNSAAVACPTCGATIPLVNPAVAVPQPNVYAANAYPTMMAPPMPLHVPHPQTVGVVMQPRPGMSGQSTWLVAGALGIAAIAVITAVAALMRPTMQPSDIPSGAAPYMADQIKELRTKNGELEREIKTRENTIKQLEGVKTRLEQDNKTLSEKVVFTDRWQPASFFVLDQSSSAVALQATEANQFRVLGKAKPPWVEYAHRVANTYQIPRLDRDPTLAREIYKEAKVDELLSEALATSLRKNHWHSRRYVQPYGPNENPTFVSFLHVREKRNRIGFFSKAALSSKGGPELEFWPVGNEMVQMPANVIDPSTAFTASSEQLSLEPETDFLDLCALRIAQKLGPADDNTPRLINVAIEVKADWLDEFIKQSKIPDDTWVDRYFDFIARARLEPYRPSARKADARALRIKIGELKDELHARLNKLEVPLVEREHLDVVDKERALANRPDFAPVNFSKMDCATHIVVADVGKPTNDGKWRLSVRLVEVGKAQPILAETCDIDRRKPTTVGTFFLDSGTTARVTLEKRGVEEKMPVPKLGYIEQNEFGDGQMFRGLFGQRTAPLSGSNPTILNHLNIREVRPNERLTVLMWELARNLLPRGGRVVKIEDDRGLVSLGRDSGFESGTRCKVWRINGNATAASSIDNWRVLPILLSASEVTDTSAKVAIVPTGLEQLWPASSKLAVNDIVVRKDASAPFVAVMPSRLNLNLTGPQQNVLEKIRNTQWPRWEKFLRLCEAASVQLGNKTRECLSLQNVAVADFDSAEVMALNAIARIEQGLPLLRQKGLTHVIYGEYAPNGDNDQALQVTFNLSVYDVATGEIVVTLPRVDTTVVEVNNWQAKSHFESQN